MIPFPRRILGGMAAALGLGAITGAAHAAVGDPLPTIGRQFAGDNFRTWGVGAYDTTCNPSSGRYQRQYCGQGAANSSYPRTHGEMQCYVDGTWAGVETIKPDPAGGIDITGGLLSSYPTAQKACPASETYVSGMLTTWGKFSMAAGYFEITAQFDKPGSAYWPAAWLLVWNAKNPGQWPPEIDFCEEAANGQNASQHSTSHPNGISSPQYPNFGSLAGAVHTCGVLLDPTHNMIRWYVDRKEIMEMGADAGVLGQPYYLIINQALSGQAGGWTGAPDASTLSKKTRIVSWAAYGPAS